MAAKNIEAIYPLSPMQQGMLFHTLLAPENGQYLVQFSCVMESGLDVAAFKRAWQSTIDRHSILRTEFAWDRLNEPMQIVRRQVRLPWIDLDWSGLTEGEQQEHLEEYLREDRDRGFELSNPPLMRFALMRLAEESYQFVWSNHHLIIDGWSRSIVIQEVLAFYRAYSRGEEINLVPSPPYADYIAWLQEQNMSKAETYWRERLKGFSSPTLLSRDTSLSERSTVDQGSSKLEVRFPASTTTALQSLAKKHHVTANTVMQGAWALLLSRYSGSQDVVFGATVSGRPPQIAGIDKMVGMFINTLPVRVNVRPDERVVGYLKQLQQEQVEQREYDYSSLVEVQGWSDVPRGTPLFDSCVVFQNYPADDRVVKQVRRRNAGLIIDQFEGHADTTYPLTLVASLTDRLKMIIRYDRRRFEDATIERMLDHLQKALEGFLADPSIQLIDIALSTDDRRAAFLADLDSQVGDEAEQFDFQF